jgi:hypothetical protein
MASKSLMEGLKNHSPSAEDASTRLPKGPSVNADATRSKPATTPPTLGPRTA